MSSSRRARAARAEGGEEELPPLPGSVLAALYRGDVALPETAECYALFPESVTPTLSASDFLSLE